MLYLFEEIISCLIINTFEDADVASAAQRHEQQKAISQGLHFLLVQPDDSGMTYSGFWLLQSEP